MKVMKQNKADIRWIKNTVFVYFLTTLEEGHDITIGPAYGHR